MRQATPFGCGKFAVKTPLPNAAFQSPLGFQRVIFLFFALAEGKDMPAMRPEQQFIVGINYLLVAVS